MQFVLMPLDVNMLKFNLHLMVSQYIYVLAEFIVIHYFIKPTNYTVPSTASFTILVHIIQ